VYLSDGYPQATAEEQVRPRRRAVYLSDGYPQATAISEAGSSGRKVYLSDGYPQATARIVGRHELAECT